MSLLPAHPPVGWRDLCVGDLAEFVNGFAFKPADWGGDGLPIIRIQNLTDPTKPMNYTSRKVADKYLVDTGDILVSWSATLDAFIWSGPTALLNQHIFKVVPKQDICEPRFLFHLLKCVIRHMAESEHLHGSTMKHINRGPFLSFPVAVPSLEEQRCLVTRIEEMMGSAQRARDALVEVPRDIQALLTKTLYRAVSGQLSRDWRTLHPNCCIEPERRKEGATVQESEYFQPAWELPSSWTWVPVGKAGEVQLGRQRAPKYHSGDNMRPYLRTANVFEDQIDTSDVLSMEFNEKDYETYRLQYGDILLNEGQSRELVGRPAMFRGEVQGACFQNTLVRFRSASDVDPEYALLVFRYCLRSGRFQRIAQWSTNIAHLGAGRFAQIEFPLPPFAEQKVIVRRAHAEMNKIHTVLNMASDSDRELAALERAFLRAIFQGHS